MLSFLWSRAAPRWSGSEFSELPVFDGADDQELRDWRLLAGGLALVLSRCSERIAQRDFPSSLAAYRLLKRQLQQGGPVRLTSRLLNDLAHEIALVADAATREAAKRCLRRQLRAAQ